MRISPFLSSILLLGVVNAQSVPLVPSEYLAPKYLAASDAPSNIVIAGPNEPGERLVVTGRVIYGAKPIAAASVHVFHADAKGFYATGRRGPDAELDPRLHGALRTDVEGRYQYDTIRPGSYDNNAAHVHYVVVAPGYKPRIFELEFQDDPILVKRRQNGEEQVPQSLRNSPFYKAAPDSIAIRPVIRDDAGTWHAVRDLDMIPE
jgi:protocatechuate 3,4-dioxygenase beta subunit